MKSLFPVALGVLMLAGPVIANAATSTGLPSSRPSGAPSATTASAHAMPANSESQWASMLNYQDGVDLTPSTPLAANPKVDPPDQIARQNGVLSLLNRTGGEH